MSKNGVFIPNKWLYIGGPIFIVVIVAILMGKHIVNIFDVVKITPIEPTKDTISQQPIQNNKSDSPNNTQPEVITKRKTTVKSGDTTVTVEGQPAIINTGQNNGVMGNNNSNIVINPKPKLTDTEKQKLIIDINHQFKSNGKDFRTDCVDVVVPAGNNNPDTGFLAQDVEKFLLNQGYNVQNVTGQYYDIPNYKNVISFKYREDGSCLYVIVWLP